MASGLISDQLASMYTSVVSEEKENKQLSKALSDAEKKARDLAKGHRCQRDDQVIYILSQVHFFGLEPNFETTNFTDWV